MFWLLIWAILQAFLPEETPSLQTPGTILNMFGGVWLLIWTVRSSFSGSELKTVCSNSTQLIPSCILPSSVTATVEPLTMTSGASLTSSIKTVTSPWANSFESTGSRAFIARVNSPCNSASSFAQLLIDGQRSCNWGAWIAATRKPRWDLIGAVITILISLAQMATGK